MAVRVGRVCVSSDLTSAISSYESRPDVTPYHQADPDITCVNMGVIFLFMQLSRILIGCSLLSQRYCKLIG